MNVKTMNSNDPMKYYMAAERVQNLIYTIEGMLQFMEEFQVKPDDSVKNALMPAIQKLKEWIK